MRICISNIIKLLLSASILLVIGCKKKEDDKTSEGCAACENTALPRYLYVTSGGCYAGGTTTSAGISTIAKYTLSGSFVGWVVDYNSFSPGDTPVSMADINAYQMYVAVENTGGRRIDLVNKFLYNSLSTYITNGTALTSALKQLLLQPDGSLLVSRTTAIEKFGSSKNRVPSASPFITAPGSTCATSATMISSIQTLSNGKLIFAHAAATPNNKLGLVSANGYVTTADCLSTQAAPTTTALPTAVVAHSSGVILVGYGSTTAASNLIYSYDLDQTTNVWSNPVASYTDNTVVNGISAMVEDKSTGQVYVANGNSVYNSIEKFNFNTATDTLTRVGTTPFLPNIAANRCISSMMIGN
jgi:hypothetical protein